MTRKEKFVSALKSKNPDFNIKFKNESLFMRLLGILLFFNKSFMTKYTTTIGNTIYFPSREFLLLRAEHDALITMAHEYQHAKDHQNYPIWFMFSYLFPIVVLPLAALTILFLPWWLCLTLVVLSLTPIPAPWRKNAELRGYTMSLFTYNEVLKEKKVSQSERATLLYDQADKYSDHFTSMDYYLMWPFGVEDYLHDMVRKILADELEKTDVIYGEVVEALEKSKSSS